MSQPAVVFEAFGFSWNPSEIPFPALAASDTRRAIWRAKKIFAEIIHDITVMEGNPFTVRFNEKMIHFYESVEATGMMAFLSGCQFRSKFE